jgi:hypothetical protein
MIREAHEGGAFFFFSTCVSWQVMQAGAVPSGPPGKTTPFQLGNTVSQPHKHPNYQPRTPATGIQVSLSAKGSRVSFKVDNLATALFA